MKVYLRPLAPGETDAELLWFWVALASGMFGFFWLHWGLPLPECVVVRWTGWPCPTCGGTRMARALLVGNGWEALRLNPLLMIAGVVSALYFVYSAVALTLRLRRIRLGKFTKKFGNVCRCGAVMLIVANWIYLVCTLPVSGVGMSGKSRTDFHGRSAMDVHIFHAERR